MNIFNKVFLTLTLILCFFICTGCKNHSKHNFEKIYTVEPTCEEIGYDYYKCKKCDESYIDNETSPLGHEIVLDAEVKASCTEAGLSEGSHCSRCNKVLKTQSIINPLGHIYDVVVTPPTCTEKGYTTYTCHCGDTYIDSIVDELGHDIIIDKSVEETCTSTGLTQGEHCDRCDYKVEQKFIPAIGHKESSV